MAIIESFSNDKDLLGRIEHLKLKGVDASRMTVITKEDPGERAFDHLGVKQRSTEVDTWDRIVSWFADEDPETQAMNSLRLSEAQQAEYRQALMDGKLLLHIDEPDPVKGGFFHDADKADYIDPSDSEYSYWTDNGNDGRKREARFSRDHQAEARTASPDHDEETIELREERVDVNKETVQTGEVEVNKSTNIRVEEFDVPVTREEVTVERIPVEGSPLAETYEVAKEAGVERIPITEERVRVIKERVVTEEVVIRKQTVEDVAHIREPVRYEEADVTENLPKTDTDYRR
ncbi:YsnF/AvaK domain-containing protein [Salinicoccus siamensis]|uniref:YsnF/AvaK domain-containing protein n=2 Tax=Salinicoccus siamensis TaxID=381830 RepID=A0ABV5Z7W5_9STAP